MPKTYTCNQCGGMMILRTSQTTGKKYYSCRDCDHFFFLKNQKTQSKTAKTITEQQILQELIKQTNILSNIYKLLFTINKNKMVNHVKQNPTTSENYTARSIGYEQSKYEDIPVVDEEMGGEGNNIDNRGEKEPPLA